MQEFDDELFRTDDVALKTFNDQIVAEFRANEGKIGGVFEQARVLLLTTIGAKSHQPRLTPLAYFIVGGSIVVVGSRGGASRDPDWVHNLRANPTARVEAGTESFEVTAHEILDGERNAVLSEIISVAPNFGTYPSRTTRIIPVFALQRSLTEPHPRTLQQKDHTPL
jgi:deazaflavin-dependent oxidoreductase (nitroreductase family)